MSSASAIYGQPELAVYSASKFAVRALTEALDIELRPQGHPRLRRDAGLRRHADGSSSQTPHGKIARSHSGCKLTAERRRRGRLEGRARHGPPLHPAATIVRS